MVWLSNNWHGSIEYSSYIIHSLDIEIWFMNKCWFQKVANSRIWFHFDLGGIVMNDMYWWVALLKLVSTFIFDVWEYLNWDIHSWCNGTHFRIRCIRIKIWFWFDLRKLNLIEIEIWFYLRVKVIQQTHAIKLIFSWYNSIVMIIEKVTWVIWQLDE